MIIVKVWGGIGNQLFQYVFGQYLQHKYNVDVFYDENSFISVDKLRKPELDSVETTMQINNYCSFSKERNFKNRFLRFLFEANPKNHYIEEGEKIPTTYNEGHTYFFQGYWQDYKYYEWLVKNVPDFTIKSKEFPSELQIIKEDIINNETSLSLHVRRGDYFQPQNIQKFGVCKAEYFEKAIHYVTEKIPNRKIYVFSDDLEWVKSNIQLNDNVIFIPNYKVSQFAYIELMSFCRHHIISNSSFSWWGAILNEKPKSIVICPEKWTLTSDDTIALEKWKKI